MSAKNARKSIMDWLEELTDHAELAVIGCGKILRRAKYFLAFILSAFFFLYLLTFFRDGTSNWSMLWSGLPFAQKAKLLGRVATSILDNFHSFYGIILILLSLLQGLVIMLLIYNYRHRGKSAAFSGLESSGIASVLSFLALGCPGCGVSLITPILTAIAGTSAVVLAERVGVVCAIIAFLLLIYTFIKLGYLVFIDISAQKHKEKHAKSS